MTKLQNLEINGKFRYLWLKYVTGVNLNVHCAACLKGEYSTAIDRESPGAELITLDEFPVEVFYFCGVALPFNWEDNFHLAFVSRPGSSFFVAEKNIRVTVVGAERIPITTEAMETLNHDKRQYKSFNTCRNWQFANYLHVNQILLNSASRRNV